MTGPAPAEAPAWAPPPAGSVVELHGLSKAELNGLRGISLGQSEEQRGKGRIGVRLDDARELSIALGSVNGLFTLESFEGKGVGCVARLPARAGDLLVREKPALECKLGDAPDRRQFKALPKERQEAIMSLSDAWANGPEEATLEGVVSTNALPRGPRSDRTILCVMASRFNHSCAPSAEYLWVEETGCEEVRAVRDIAVGEEVCVNYFGEAVQQPTAARLATLREGFRFNCRCLVCLAADPASDARRARIVQLGEEILTCRSQPDEGIRKAKESLELLAEERIGAPRTAAQICNDGFELALLEGDPLEVQSWAHLSYEAHRLGWGENYPMTRRMKHYAQYPPSIAPQPGGAGTAKAKAADAAPFAPKKVAASQDALLSSLD